MHSTVSLNHQIIPVREAKLSALSSAALYGSGVFTTVAVFERKPFQWQKHWQRISANAEKLNIRLSEFTEEAVAASLAALIDENRVEHGRARLTFFDEAANGIWSLENIRRTSLLITTASQRETSDELRITPSPYPVNSRSPLAGVKSCNYLENLAALEEAKSRGFDEAARLNERGEITSTCMANLFWIDGETVYTPALDTGCLDGTTRAAVIEIAKELGFDLYTLATDFDEILRADEIFLTSAGIGIKSVRSLENETYTDEITRRLRRRFYEKIS